jgi:hypothetical protein
MVTRRTEPELVGVSLGAANAGPQRGLRGARSADAHRGWGEYVMLNRRLS